jgi:predicted GNAT family acetyltransferase
MQAPSVSGHDGDMDTPVVVYDADGRRFVADSDEYTAELVVRVRGDRLVLVHTEVPDELSGRGLGGALVSAAVDHAVEHELVVVPNCPFARRWLQDHSDVAGRANIAWDG